jgi:hypothetical protein
MAGIDDPPQNLRSHLCAAHNEADVDCTDRAS